MTPDDPRHGTYAGYQQHYRHGHKPCAPCKEANNEYQRRYRLEKPDVEAAAQATQHRRDKALRILGQRHSVELEALIALLEYQDEDQVSYAWLKKAGVV